MITGYARNVATFNSHQSAYILCYLLVCLCIVALHDTATTKGENNLPWNRYSQIYGEKGMGDTTSRAEKLGFPSSFQKAYQSP